MFYCNIWTEGLNEIVLLLPGLVVGTKAKFILYSFLLHVHLSWHYMEKGLPFFKSYFLEGSPKRPVTCIFHPHIFHSALLFCIYIMYTPQCNTLYSLLTIKLLHTWRWTSLSSIQSNDDHSTQKSTKLFSSSSSGWSVNVLVQIQTLKLG